MTPLLATLLALTASVWVGGLVVIVVVARVAHRTLDDAARVAFFRGLGRAYGPLGGACLVLALASAAVLVADRPRDGLLAGAAVTAAALAAVTVIGVLQARRMTRLRTAVLDGAGSASVVTRAARGAAALRAVMAVLTLVLLVQGVLLAT